MIYIIKGVNVLLRFFLTGQSCEVRQQKKNVQQTSKMYVRKTYLYEHCSWSFRCKDSSFPQKTKA